MKAEEIEIQESMNEKVKEKPREDAPEELSPARELAADLIDDVIETIIDQHPEIGDLVAGYKGHTLIHGTPYYTLEDEITEKIEELKK